MYVPIYHRRRSLQSAPNNDIPGPNLDELPVDYSSPEALQPLQQRRNELVRNLPCVTGCLTDPRPYSIVQRPQSVGMRTLRWSHPCLPPVYLSTSTVSPSRENELSPAAFVIGTF